VVCPHPCTLVQAEDTTLHGHRVCRTCHQPAAQHNSVPAKHSSSKHHDALLVHQLAAHPQLQLHQPTNTQPWKLTSWLPRVRGDPDTELDGQQVGVLLTHTAYKQCLQVPRVHAVAQMLAAPGNMIPSLCVA
jgi:hypothetical protein